MCTLSCPKHPSSGCAGTMCLCSCQSLHLSPGPWQKPLFVTRLIIKILQLINGSVLRIPPLCRQLPNSFIWIMISEGKYNLAVVVEVFRQFSRWKTPGEKDSYNKNMKTEGCESKPGLISCVFRQNPSSPALNTPGLLLSQLQFASQR